MSAGPDPATRDRRSDERVGARHGAGEGLDVVVQLHGSIHDQALLILAAELSEALDLRPGWLILDLTDCTALGAGALQLLNDAHRHAASCGGQLVLLHPTAELARTLAMSGLLAHVTVDLRTQPRAS